MLLAANMPLNDADKAWVRQEIQNSRKHGVLTYIREWLPFAGVITLLVFIVTQWGDYKEFEGSTVSRELGANERFDAYGKRFDKIESHLGEIDGKLEKLLIRGFPGKTFQEIEKLDQRSFANALPQLSSLLTAPTHAKVAPAVLRSIAQKLQNTDPASPDYWPTALRFIQFASAGLSPDVPPPGSPVYLHVGPANFDLEVHLSHVVVKLDGGGSIKDSTFSNSRIIFTDKPEGMKNVTFTNCVFEMPDFPESPYLQKATQTILASDLKSVSFQGM